MERQAHPPGCLPFQQDRPQPIHPQVPRHRKAQVGATNAWAAVTAASSSKSSSSINSSQWPANSQQPGNLWEVRPAARQAGMRAGAGRPFPKLPFSKASRANPKVTLSGKRASASLWPFAFLSLRLYHSPIFTYTKSIRAAQPNQPPPPPRTPVSTTKPAGLGTRSPRPPSSQHPIAAH